MTCDKKQNSFKSLLFAKCHALKKKEKKTIKKLLDTIGNFVKTIFICERGELTFINASEYPRNH